MIKRTTFVEGATYHVYNRGNGHDHIFRNPGNYDYFLRKYHEYMGSLWETHAWCLMPNHFHFLITVKAHFSTDDILSTKCSSAFANFTNGYAQSFNKQHNRKGSVFMRSFRRKVVHDREYFKSLVCYVHNNPVKDGMVPAPENWPFSSYSDFINRGASVVGNDPVISLFGGKEEFRRQHILHRSPGSIEIPWLLAS